MGAGRSNIGIDTSVERASTASTSATSTVSRLLTRNAQSISAEPARQLSLLLSADKREAGWPTVDPNPKQCLSRYRNFVSLGRWWPTTRRNAVCLGSESALFNVRECARL